MFNPHRKNKVNSVRWTGLWTTKHNFHFAFKLIVYIIHQLTITIKTVACWKACLKLLYFFICMPHTMEKDCEYSAWKNLSKFCWKINLCSKVGTSNNVFEPYLIKITQHPHHNNLIGNHLNFFHKMRKI